MPYQQFKPIQKRTPIVYFLHDDGPLSAIIAVISVDERIFFHWWIWTVKGSHWSSWKWTHFHGFLTQIKRFFSFFDFVQYLDCRAIQESNTEWQISKHGTFFFSLSMRLFFCLFQMYRIVTCLYISGNFEKSSALIGLNIWKKSQLHCKCGHTKNAITFINKSNACCGYFVMRLSLHGIALMCLSCFRSILVIGCTFDRAVRV